MVLNICKEWENVREESVADTEKKNQFFSIESHEITKQQR